MADPHPTDVHDPVNKYVAFLPIVICFLSITFITSCGGSLPGPDEYVTIHPMTDKVITYEEMKSVLSKHNIDIPPSYVSTSGTILHAVVIPLDIFKISGNVTYDEVRVTVTVLERDGITYSEDTDNIAVLTAIPQSVDRSADIEVTSKVAANFAAAISELSGNISAEQSKKESYVRLYRTVTANLRSPTLLIWTFTPFKDEPIFAGTYYVIALIEVRDQTREFLVQVHSNCKYGTPIWFGLSRKSQYCESGVGKLDLVQAGQQAPPLPSEEIVLVFGGQWQIREAVLDAVDWSSLIRDRNVNLIFKDLEGEQVDVSSRGRDIERCQQLLAEAGYPDGYPDLRLMIWPASEALIQIAEKLGAYFADCGIGESLEMVNSYQDAHLKLRQSSMAGESGLLLSTQIEE